MIHGVKGKEEEIPLKKMPTHVITFILFWDKTLKRSIIGGMSKGDFF